MIWISLFEHSKHDMDLLVIALSFDKNYVIKFLKGGKISDKEMVCHLILKFPDMGLLPVFQTNSIFLWTSCNGKSIYFLQF